MEQNTNLVKKYIVLILLVVLLLFVATFSAKIFETNQFGNYQLKQSAGTGKIRVVNKSGLYMQNFGSIHTYRVSDENYFSKLEADGGSGTEAEPIIVRFNDGSKAEVSGMIKYRLSLEEEMQKKLHRDFKSYTSVKNGIIRQVITEALMQTATLMQAEESYSSRRGEFTSIAENQVKEGIFETITKDVESFDDDGTKFVKKTVSVKLDKDGKPVVRKVSPFKEYKIEVLQFVIKDIDFDKTIDALIAKKKEAEQQKIVAKVTAEKAKQDAITTREQGKAKVANAEALALIDKKTAVINSQKEREVAEENALKAIAEARSIKAKGQAEAYAAKLKVQAGLSPRERAEFEMKTAIGVAEKLSQVKFPDTMVIGGNGNGQALNPFDAVGLKSFIELSKDLSGKR